MAQEVGLPIREFFYTVDQIALLLELREQYVRERILFYEGRSVGAPRKDEMVAVNFAHEGDKPEWRIAERHLKRWMRFKGYKIYDRGYLR